jgi:NAD(P)H-hydrate epimerase
MIPVVSVDLMRRIDEKAIKNDIAVGYSYMLRAGAGVYDVVRAMAPDPRHGEIAVVCGKGNNGGDGFVVARLLLEAGYRVMCFGLSRSNELTPETRLAYDQYLACDGNFLLLDDTEDIRNLCRSTLIIDALLGTGLSGNPQGLFAETIEAINQSGIPVVAVDTPSGLDNDAGIPGTPCIHAKATVTMGFPKIGTYFYPGKSVVGDYIIKDLGYPEEIVEECRPGLFLPTPEKLRKVMPPRKPSGSKFDHGVACMLCGSAGMTGSAALSSKAAMRTGCGMVRLFTPAGAVNALSAHCVEVVLQGIAETEAGSPAYSALDSLRSFASGAQAFGIGPGISHEEETGRLVRELAATVDRPLILDADGINAYKGRPEDLKRHACPLLITPHSGEWGRVFSPLPKHPLDAVRVLKETAVEYAMTILYKGSPTIVADSQGRAYLLPFGNSGMATAGCGDVLTGIIASLAAQGCGLTDAAILGAFIHGQAGNAASKEFGEYGMIASDILNAIPGVLKALIEQV